MDNKVLGNKGEQAAATYLTKHGYQICARNFRVPVGEIDIIAEHDDVLAFVEVKTRRGLRCGFPAQAVTYYKQQKIRKIASLYLTKHNLYEKVPIRFDVIDILGEKVTHIKNAF